MALKLVKDLDQAWILWHAGLLVSKDNNPWTPPSHNDWSEVTEDIKRKTFNTAINNYLNGDAAIDTHYGLVFSWKPFVNVEEEESTTADEEGECEAQEDN